MEIAKSVIQQIIAWYKKNKISLPWREDPTPYHVWVSEIMLQQTRIEAVIPHYNSFLRAFPDIGALAGADDEVLMKLWQGLGYYSRAANLKKAAQVVVKQYGSSLPRQAERLQKLPGIGAYTAGAIASIAYGEPAPAVDGNVLRVLSRILTFDDDVMLPQTRKAVTAALKQVYPCGQEAGLLTEGLMELGERVCLPKGRPQCDRCPVREACEAHRQGRELDYPTRLVTVKRKTEEKTVFLFFCHGKVALHKRPAKGLLASLWEFPNREGTMTLEQVQKEYPQSKKIGTAKHLFTHIEWHMTGYRVEVEAQDPSFIWVTPDEMKQHYALPSAFAFFEKKTENAPAETK